MTTIELLTELRTLGVRLWTDGGALRYSAPPGVLSENLRARIRERKDDVLRVLATAGGEPDAQRRIPVGERGVDAPLSFSQEGMWFLNELERGRPHNPYLESSAFHISGALDIDLMRRTLSEIVRRHDILRTVYPVVDGVPVQRVLSTVEVPLPVTDPGECDGRDAEILRAVAAERARTLDLAIEPPCWFRVLRFAADDHILVATMHHIVGDAWSREVIGAELMAIYAALGAGMPAPLPDLEIQYADFARWQRDNLQGERLDSLLEYWGRRLDGAARLELPRDRPQTAAEAPVGAECHFRIDERTTSALREFTRREGTTLFVTLLTAFATLLHRYTGQHDVVLATETANRGHRQTEPLIGILVNQLVLRLDLSGDPTFQQALVRAQQVVVGAQEHQDLPFERLVEHLRPDRDDHQPLVQATFGMDNIALPGTQPPGLSITPLRLDYNTLFDLALFLRDNGEVIEGPLAYNAAMFDHDRIVRLLAQYRTLLADVLAHPDRPVSRLRFLPDDEYDLVTRTWNDTAESGHPAVPVHQTFERQVDLEPDRTAIVYKGHHLSYRALDDAANRLARRLIEAGVVAESLVGIYLGPSLERVIGTLAILKAGGALVFVDPTYPRDRVNLMVSTANLTALLTTSDLDPHLPDDEFETIQLDAEAAALAKRSAARPDVTVLPGQLQYAIYTSGTTGTPKRIGVPHALFHNLMSWHECEPSLLGRSRTLQFSTFGFCVSFQEIHTTLAEGGTIIMAPSEVRTDAALLVDVLRAEAVERLFLPLGALKLLAQVATRTESIPTRLRAVVTAGEPLEITEHLVTLFDRLPGCPLHNQYGASETHVVTAHTLTGEPRAWPTSVPIGRPNRNNRIYLLDSALRPVPVGVPGELYVGGAGVPRGYLDEPAMTSIRMVADPFVPGARMYRTGDLAQWEPDGEVRHLGRADHQIKIRGYRVELGEVAAVLRTHDLVADVAVAAVGDGHDRRLVAYAVPTAPRPDLAEQLWRHCTRALPRHMVPSDFVELPELPLNANGKLDHPALPVPAGIPRFSEHAFVAPRSELEEELADIWREVLGVDRIGVYDSFFDLGGHSLPATRIVFLIGERLGVDIAVRTLFEDPTIAGLTVRVVEAQLVDATVVDREPV